MKKNSLIACMSSINFILLLIISCNLLPTTSEPINLVTPTAGQTITSTPTKTPFPINTLTALERENFVRESLSTSSDCNLPCWWGIKPGETRWVETEQFLQYLGVRIGSSSGYDPEAIFHGTGGFDFQGIVNHFSFEEHNGVVDAILIRSEGYSNFEEFQLIWQHYSPEKILKMYGVPDRVLLNVTEPYALSRGYHLWFFYDNLGIMILYPGGVQDAPVLRLCPVFEVLQAIELSLQAPNSLLPLERFDGILEDIRLQTETGKTRALHTIHEATGMNEKEFYELFMQDEELICFETPSYIWDIEQ